ncbi:hypothetical protein GQ457_03G032150 [Hibiscus cannabinus]
MENIMNRFWWRNKPRQRGIHWTTWSTLSLPKIAGGMGFRDLAKFNIALLAKPGWNLIVNPNSLLARVYKAKYFPNGDFLSARLGSYSSYTWKSIWCSRGLLEQGLGWRIGNGSSINIWQDAWIAGHGNGRVSGVSPDFHYSKVSELIDFHTHTWKHELCRTLFTPLQAAQVFCIPLPLCPSTDLCIWRGDPSGLYSVRSGYRWLINTELAVSGDPNSLEEDGYNRLCKSFWSVSLPTKVKVFFWRFIHNLLPTFKNLRIRQINVNPQCLFCHASEESMLHLIYECPFVQQILSRLDLVSTSISIDQNFILWLSNLFYSLNLLKRKYFIVSLWAIWGSRNKLLHEGISQTVEDIVLFSKMYIQEVDASNLPRPSPSTVRNDRWSPPAIGLIKANFDASFDIGSLSSVSGIIVRNEEGLIMAAGIYPNRFVANPELAEAVACEQTLIFLKDLGFRRAVVEGDSLSVIFKLCHPLVSRSILSVHLNNILRRQRDFDHISFSHVSRESNKAAHLLARFGRSLSESRFWLEEAPSEVEPATLQDRWWVDTPD